MGSSKVGKCEIRPENVPMDISEKNETITFLASNTFNK